MTTGRNSLGRALDPFSESVTKLGLRGPYDPRYEELRFELQALSTRCSCYMRDLREPKEPR
jgi:hypothetical protein